MLLCPKPGLQPWRSPLLGCAAGALAGRWVRVSPGAQEALAHPALPSGQPAADTHGSGLKEACLGGDTHLSWLHSPGCRAQDPAVSLGLGHGGAGPGRGGPAWLGLTRTAIRLCVCEDPRLRRRRRAPPLGELRVPLRKLVPNQARSFDVCLEKWRLVSGAQGELWGPAPCDRRAGKGRSWEEDLGGV